ncbi:MAG TPA: chorismate synthase, partial [Acidimicrobiia bacterium]
MLRFLTAGESHGPGLVAVLEGLPNGVEVSIEGIADELCRRRMGHGRGRRMRIERDELEVLGGVRFGRTLGGPVAVIIRNTEWPKWEEEMSPRPGTAERPLTTPRPGHADLPGMIKTGTHDARDVLERSSARETATRTVVGYLCKQLLATVGVQVISHVVAIGEVEASGTVPGPGDLATIDASPVRTFDRDAEGDMVAAIDRAHAERDTLGGVVEVL